MKVKCLFKSIVRGDVVKRGQVLDLTPEECKADVIRSSFVKVEGGEAEAPAAPAPVARADGLVAGLTRDQAIMKLTQSGAKVKGNISNRALAELYNQTFANAAEAAAPAA